MNPKDLVGAKKAPLRYVPPAGAIESSGPHEDGAIKYGPFNWRTTPVEMVTYLEAIDRHLAALKDGQDFAEDSGYSHIGHIIAGANIIADAKAHGTLIDNRFAAGPAADMLRARDKSVLPPLTLVPEPVGEVADITVSPLAQFILGVPTEGDLDDRLFFAGTPFEVVSEGKPDVNVTYRGVWPPDTRVAGLLTCCGQSEHSLDCPQWR